jgi:hypothetical protein
MKRLLSVCLLMLCLSIPAFAGHSLPGGWCECGAPGCQCDPGEVPPGGQPNPGVPDNSIKGTPTDLGSETLLVLGLLLLMLRYKA